MVGGFNANISAAYTKPFADELGWYDNTNYFGADLTGSYLIGIVRIGYRRGVGGSGDNDDRILGSVGIGF
jgi:hypothetical protein